MTQGLEVAFLSCGVTGKAGEEGVLRGLRGKTQLTTGGSTYLSVYVLCSPVVVLRSITLRLAAAAATATATFVFPPGPSPMLDFMPCIQQMRPSYQSYQSYGCKRDRNE